MENYKYLPKQKPKGKIRINGIHSNHGKIVAKYNQKSRHHKFNTEWQIHPHPYHAKRAEKLYISFCIIYNIMYFCIMYNKHKAEVKQFNNNIVDSDSDNLIMHLCWKIFFQAKKKKILGRYLPNCSAHLNPIYSE